MALWGWSTYFWRKKESRIFRTLSWPLVHEMKNEWQKCHLPSPFLVYFIFKKTKWHLLQNRSFIKANRSSGEKNIPRLNSNIERDRGGGIYSPFFKYLPEKSILLKSECFGRYNCKFCTYNSVLHLSTYNSVLLREQEGWGTTDLFIQIDYNGSLLSHPRCCLPSEFL